MARSNYAAAQVVQPDGLINPSLAAVNVDGNMFANNGKQFLWIDNPNGATCTVTIQTPKTIGGLAVAEQTVAIPTTQAALIGPFATGIYSQISGADQGKVYVDYSIDTSVTAALLQLAD